LAKFNQALARFKNKEKKRRNGGEKKIYSSPILRTWAAVGRFSRVETLMPLQIFLPCKGLATVEAVEGPIRFYPHVKLDVPVKV
jgi:hypothetical protein